VYSSPARVRAERDAARRSNVSAIIGTLLSLAVVAAAVGIVAYLVLRTPDSAVDSAQRLEPVGTALPAPTDQPSQPTVVPTPEPEPTALGYTGDTPAVVGLPTVAAPDVAGPTPTPRVIALPTAPPPTAAPPPPTLPPAPPAEDVPVVALQPVESAPAPTTPAIAAQAVTQPTPDASTDNDRFTIFSDDEIPRIMPAQNEALERARALQDGNGGRNQNQDQGSNRDSDQNRDQNRRTVDPPGNAAPVIVPTIAMPAVVAPTVAPIVRNDDGSVQIVMPDVNATIAAITARATDPNRNPNVNGNSRPGADRNVKDPTPSAGSKKKSARDRNNDRKTPTPRAGSGSRSDSDSVIPDMPDIGRIIGNNDNGNGNGNGKDCQDPFAALPADKRPKDFPFDKC